MAIGVVLQDDQGAVSLQQSVDLTVQPAALQGNGQDRLLAGTVGNDHFVGSAGSETMEGRAGADVFVLMAGGGHDSIDGGGGSWLDTIEVNGAGPPGAGSWTMVIDTAQRRPGGSRQYLAWRVRPAGAFGHRRAAGRCRHPGPRL